MRRATIVVAAAWITCGVSALAWAAPQGDGARVGEVRAFAVPAGNADAISALHHDGWIEANGELLSVAQFQALYREIGRAWTARGVAENQFAVPQLRDPTQNRRSSENPYGVLSAADLVTSGRIHRAASRTYPLSYWIFAGPRSAETR